MAEMIADLPRPLRGVPHARATKPASSELWACARFGLPRGPIGATHLAAAPRVWPGGPMGRQGEIPHIRPRLFPSRPSNAALAHRRLWLTPAALALSGGGVSAFLGFGALSAY